MISKPVWRGTLRFRRGLLLPAGAALLLLLLWFFPALLATSGALNPLLQAFLGDSLQGEVSIGRARLGWLSSVELREVRVVDDSGQTLLEVASVRGERTLWQLIASRDDLGLWVVERPEARIILEDQTSNLERLLGGMGGESPPADSAAPLPAATIRVVDGRATLVDAVGGATVHVLALQAELQSGGAEGETLAARLTAQIQPDQQASPPGEIRLEARFLEPAPAASGPGSERATRVALERASPPRAQDSHDQDTHERGDLDFHCRGVNLAALDPLLRRVGLEMQVRGTLSGDVALRAAADGSSMRLQMGSLDGQWISVHWPRYLGAEPIRLPRVRGEGTLELDTHRLELDDVVLDCDVAVLHGDGTLSLEALQRSAGSAGTLDAVAGHSGRVAIRVDLARAAAAMPTLLRVRDDTHIEAGLIDLELVSRQEDDQQRWDVRLVSSELAAVRAGRRIQWPQPIQLLLAARHTPAGLVIDQLRCDGHFIDVHGSGSLADASFSAQADLSRMKSALDQFFDLPDLVLAGQLQTSGQWRREDAERFHLEGQVTAESLRVSLSDQRAWSEPRLDVAVQATGRCDAQLRPQSLEMLRVVLQAGEDQARIELVEPVQGLDPVQGACTAVVEGRLESWLSRLRPVFDPQAVDLAGKMRGEWTLSQQGNTTSVAGGAVLTDVAVYRETSAARQAADRPGQPVWTEPRLEIDGQATLERAAESRFLLQNLRVVAPHAGAAIRLGGTVTDFSQRVMVDLQGELDYDLATAVHRLRELVGPQLQVTGREQRRFLLKGPLRPSPEELSGTHGNAATAAALEQAPPLVPSELQGEAAMGWRSVNYLGVPVGPGQLLSRLQGGVVSIDPLDLEVSRGRLQLEPHIQLNGTPPTLVLKPGPLITRMQIAPEMFRGWMRYVAPLLADATRAEGEFSVELDQAALPLGLPERSTFAGTLTVHAARIGPGPLAQQLLAVVDQLQAVIQQRPVGTRFSGAAQWVTMPAQSIDLRMVDGRVHHRRLQLLVDDVAIWTEGSVGLDETVQLEAQIPVQDAWIARQPWLASLQGKVLRLPIRGTLSRPSVDGGALRDFGRRAAREAAGQLLEKELGRGLQKLFGPRPAEPPAPNP